MTSLNPPEEFIDKEPSLNDLKNIIEKHPIMFTDIDTSVIYWYHNTSRTDNGTDFYYYLGGHILINSNKPITASLIKSVNKINSKILHEYGVPTNNIEQINTEICENYFSNLQKIIEKYYEFMLHELYRPPDLNIKGDKGGELYQKLEEMTVFGKPSSYKEESTLEYW